MRGNGRFVPQRMSKISPRRVRSAGLKRTFVIVASRFNAPYVDGLIEHTRNELAVLAPGATISLHRVPGAFEIPIVVQEIAAKCQADAIIALGVILKGKTSHAENLARSVTNALQQIALDHSVPVLHAVLCLENEIEARERCLENEINRGVEAARAAVAMADTMSSLRRT
jgi:6,7-dimethyl-8-ribityllumazine synthase